MLYETLNESPGGLRAVGLAVGAGLLFSHALALWQGAAVRKWLETFPFQVSLGRVLMAVAGCWAFFLFRGLDLGFLEIPRMDMGEFHTLRTTMLWVVPVATILVVAFCEEFLPVRAVGSLLLLAAALLLDAAFQREPVSRLFLVVLAYVWIVAGLFWIGMPYLLRDQIQWAVARDFRWKALCGAGMIYGLVLAVCAVAFW